MLRRVAENLRSRTMESFGETKPVAGVVAQHGLDAAFMLADTVELMTVELTAVCRGTLGGAALAPFAIAPRRGCSRHAIFRMSEPRVSISGRAQEIDARAAALRARLDRLVAWIAEATGQPADQIAADMDHGRVLGADEALDYGLVHEISRPERRPAHDRSKP